MEHLVGQLLPQDELFCHQVTETFANAGTSDPAWTEKVCAMAAAKDGSIQLGFGLGKYVNRNVMDAYAGVSRGVEQVTVRASRRLAPDPELTVIGPVRYEVVEPLRAVRFVLEPNDVQPIAFDWTFEGVLPARVEDRTHIRTGYRVSAELVRFHQIGMCSGWLEVAGERTELDPDTWVSTRDHSWGVRYGVGAEPIDLEPRRHSPDSTYHFAWSPILLERPDGSRYGIFLNFGNSTGPGYEHRVTMGGVEHPDGGFERIDRIHPELRYDPANRRLLGGSVHLTMADGSVRRLDVEPVSDTGFHLGTGLYFGFDGRHHGEWRGELHTEGEWIPDCSDPATARRVHQIRDTVVRVSDPMGGGVGVGNWQPMITGGFPDLGLDAASSFT
ncbi:MAG: hypothetical protein MUE34_09845 [Acidimicrobiales bacterium]|jgi:hypothetical protein|nr:hypothetical protein [Acidimicrobiales bacterium]